MFVTGLVMAASLAVDIGLAARLGTGQVSDMIIVAWTLPRLVDVLAREGGKFSLVSLLVEKRITLTDEGFTSYFGGVFTLFLLTGALLAGLAWLAAIPLVGLLAPGLPKAATEDAVALFRVTAPVLSIAPAASLLWILLNSIERFVDASVRGLVIQLTVLAAMLLSWSSDSFDTAVTSSYAVGYLLLFLLLLLMVVRDERLSGIALTLPSRQTAREIGEAIGYPLTGFGATQIARLTERSIASMVTVGGIASYYFAFRIVSGLQSLVGVSIAIVSLPTITRHELQGKRDRFARAMVRRGAYAVGLSLVLVAAILAFNHQIVEILYGRGSFNQASVNVTASILAYFALGVPFSTLIPVLNAGLYARKQYAKVLVGMLLTAAADVGLAYWLSNILGLRGIALAFSLAALLGATVAIWLLRPGGRTNAGAG